MIDREMIVQNYNRQVAIFIDGQYFCGGSLISNEWVLTAARK